MATADATTPKTVNYYEALGLDREQTTEELQEQLEALKNGWSGKATRAGTLGDQARSLLTLIAAAEPVFADDDSREEYDLRIRRAPSASSDAGNIDWVARAWNYYYLRDEGAASVAAKKAREQDAKDVNAWVVSAWVALLNGADGRRQAKDFSDEAFVLDELGTDTADVHHVRGVVFAVAGEYDKAIKSYDRALTSAPAGEKSGILLHKAQAFEHKGEYELAFEAALAGLVDDEVGGGAARKNLVESLKLDFVSVTSQSPNEAKLDDQETKRAAVSSSAIAASVKDDFLAWADDVRAKIEEAQQFNREIAAFDEQIKSIEGQKGGVTKGSPSGNKPGFPRFQLGFALWSTLWVIIWFAASGAGSGFVVCGFISLVIAIIAFIVFGVAYTKNSDWDAETAKQQSGIRELARLNQESSNKQTKRGALVTKRDALAHSLPNSATFWQLGN